MKQGQRVYYFQIAICVLMSQNVFCQALNSDADINNFYNHAKRIVFKSIENTSHKNNFSGVYFIKLSGSREFDSVIVNCSLNTPEVLKEPLRINFKQHILDSPLLFQFIKHYNQILIPVYNYYQGNSKKSPPQSVLFSDITQMLTFDSTKVKNFDWQLGDKFEGLVLGPILFETPHYGVNKHFKKRLLKE